MANVVGVVGYPISTQFHLGSMKWLEIIAKQTSKLCPNKTLFVEKGGLDLAHGL